MAVFLRLKTPIGPSILAAGALIWLFISRDADDLVFAVQSAFTSQRSWDLLAALYFVVCLEIELRKSGTLSGMVGFLGRVLPSKKAAMSIMPAFLGLLPSVGGARFSAPIVAAIAKGDDIPKETLAGVNFWFRHIFEVSSPIVPGMILGCAIAGVSIASVIVHLAWTSAACFIFGWLILFRRTGPLKAPASESAQKGTLLDFVLAVSPVAAVFALTIAFDLASGAAMGITALAMIPVLYALKRPVALKEIFIGACEWKLFRDVGSILLFIGILSATGALSEVVSAFQSSGLPIPAVIAGIAFVVGMLTGMSQGHVSIVMPIVAALAPGSVDLAGIALVFGMGGQMVTPTHVCLMVTLDYFKADFFKTLLPCAAAEACVLALFVLISYFSWG